MKQQACEDPLKEEDRNSHLREVLIRPIAMHQEQLQCLLGEEF